MKRCRNQKKYSGMAILSVLFIVIAVTIVTMGYLHRADMAMAGGHNMAIHTRCDYLAWAGLEHARTQILSGVIASEDPLINDYTVEITPDGSNPNVYQVTASGLYNNEALSVFNATIVYDADDGSGRPSAVFASINRN